MKMNPLVTIFLTATLSTLSGAALAAGNGSDSGSGNGQANAAAEAGQVAPDAHQNMAPNGVDGNDVNTGSGSSMHNSTGTSSEPMTKDEIHKNTMCKDGKCPDINKKIQTGNGMNNDVDTKTDGTTQ